MSEHVHVTELQVCVVLYTVYYVCIFKNSTHPQVSDHLTDIKYAVYSFKMIKWHHFGHSVAIWKRGKLCMASYLIQRSHHKYLDLSCRH